jgi:hypothetical protein
MELVSRFAGFPAKLLFWWRVFGVLKGVQGISRFSA